MSDHTITFNGIRYAAHTDRGHAIKEAIIQERIDHWRSLLTLWSIMAVFAVVPITQATV